jgi:tRNA 2-thiouridine synthesizing protein A
MKKEILDATGLLCPLPVLKLRKHLKSVDIGTFITVLADDPAAAIDIPHFCNETGHRIGLQNEFRKWSKRVHS